MDMGLQYRVAVSRVMTFIADSQSTCHGCILSSSSLIFAVKKSYHCCYLKCATYLLGRLNVSKRGHTSTRRISGKVHQSETIAHWATPPSLTLLMWRTLLPLHQTSFGHVCGNGFGASAFLQWLTCLCVLFITISHCWTLFRGVG